MLRVEPIAVRAGDRAMHMLKRNGLILVGVLLAALGAVVGKSAEAERRFAVRGVVQSPFADGTISIEHDEIPGFMPAMTMPFYTSEGEARGLRRGDIVEFDFIVGESSRATNFRRVGRAALAPVQAVTVRRLREGDRVPAFQLEDQSGGTIDESVLTGRHTIVTFVFTRCPVPEFCPLIAKKFQALQQTLAENETGDDVRLLSISIDPEHDRPAVLRAYGETLGADFARWRFATGTNEQIAALTRLFAVRTERNGGLLDHTLATALIGPDGRVVEIWRGNGWKPEQVAAKVSEARSR